MNATLLQLDRKKWPFLIYAKTLSSDLIALARVVNEALGNTASSITDNKIDTGSVGATPRIGHPARDGTVQIYFTGLHGRQQASRPYVLFVSPITAQLDLNEIATTLQELHDYNILTWPLDTRRWTTPVLSRFTALDMYAVLGGGCSTNEFVTFYFRPDITDGSKLAFIQLVDICFASGKDHGELCNVFPGDYDEDDDIPVEIGPLHSVHNYLGMWSAPDGAQKVAMPRCSNALDLPDNDRVVVQESLLYCLWIAWVDDERRFNYVRDRRRVRRLGQSLKKSMPWIGELGEHADLWHIMEGFDGCYARDSRRLGWEFFDPAQLEKKGGASE